MILKKHGIFITRMIYNFVLILNFSKLDIKERQ